MSDTEIPTFRFAITSATHINEPGKGSDFVPTRGTDRATGWDVRCANRQMIIRPGQHVKIPLGFRVFAPPGWWLELRPRSSTFAKKNLHSLYGVIDEDYEGQCLFACQYIPDISSMGNDLVLEFGEAIGQVIPVKRQEMIVKEIYNDEYEKLCEERNAARKTGGFGSTG
jgi:dUTPase